MIWEYSISLLWKRARGFFSVKSLHCEYCYWSWFMYGCSPWGKQMLTVSPALPSALRVRGLLGLPFPGCSAEGLSAAQLFKNQPGRHLWCHLQRISHASPFPGPVLTLRHALQLMGSRALISCHTKDNSKYSLSAATAASVLMSI